MTASLYLTRTDPARNMARFYVVTVQPTLFGEWAVIREWGRIGQSGQVKATACASYRDAEALGSRLRQQKTRRGYTARQS